MTLAPEPPRRRWREALANRAVWRRTLRIGLPVGVLQVMINQGDHWLAGHVSLGVVLKSIAAPIISVGIAWAAAAATHRQNP